MTQGQKRIGAGARLRVRNTAVAVTVFQNEGEVTWRYVALMGARTLTGEGYRLLSWALDAGVTAAKDAPP